MTMEQERSWRCLFTLLLPLKCKFTLMYPGSWIDWARVKHVFNPVRCRVYTRSIQSAYKFQQEIINKSLQKNKLERKRNNTVRIFKLCQLFQTRTLPVFASMSVRNLTVVLSLTRKILHIVLVTAYNMVLWIRQIFHHQCYMPFAWNQRLIAILWKKHSLISPIQTYLETNPETTFFCNKFTVVLTISLY